MKTDRQDRNNVCWRKWHTGISTAFSTQRLMSTWTRAHNCFTQSNLKIDDDKIKRRHERTKQKKIVLENVLKTVFYLIHTRFSIAFWFSLHCVACYFDCGFCVLLCCKDASLFSVHVCISLMAALADNNL